MPLGRYPERVKDFRKWSNDRVDKAKINDSATGSGSSRPKTTRKRTKRMKRTKTSRKKQE